MSNVRWYHITAGILAIATLVVMLYAVRSILPLFIIAFAVAWLLDPVLDKLESRGWPRIYAVISVYLLFLAFFVTGLIFLVPAVIDQAKQLAKDFPHYLSLFEKYGANLMRHYKPTLLQFQLPTTLQEVFNTYGDKASAGFTQAIRGIALWITSNLSKALWFVLIPLVSFYFLNDIDRMRAKSTLLIPERWRTRTTSLLSRMGAVFSNYVRGLFIVCLIYGVVTALILSFLDVKYSILIGFLSGILYAVPYIGAFVTTLLVLLVALATNTPNSLHAFWIPPIAMLILNQAFDFFISPKILGKSVGLHPVLSLFALLAGGNLFGLVGMILAVPIAASIQEAIFEVYPDLRKEPVINKPLQKKNVRKSKESKPSHDETMVS
ncbi:MAG: AI-2E family transporter [Armatimonadota bacterium]